MLSDQRMGYARKRKKTNEKFKSLAAVTPVLRLPKQQTIIHDRLIETAVMLKSADEPEITFQHSLLCQTSLPYRNPGDDVRTWERLNGRSHLKIIAGEAMSPKAERLVPLGLPFGPKPRLLLAHLNAEAIRTQSPDIEVEASLTAFVKRLGLDGNGRDMRTIKDQLARLSAATMRLGMVQDGAAITVNSQIVSSFDIWFPKDDHQRVLWPSTVRLSLDYFQSLQTHAVPLDERALASLSHSAMALDIYAWLAQRLHRIPKARRQMITWPALQEQFGPEFERLRKFREKFMQALRQVHAVYPAMKIDVTRHGLFLYISPPPIVKTGKVISLPPPRRPSAS